MGRPKKVKAEETKKVEPIVLDCGKPIDGAIFKGETFEIQRTTTGIVYKVYGGYAIFVSPNNVALYQTLDDLIENQAEYAKFSGEEKDNFELNLSAIAYVLNVPLFAFVNADFTYHIAEEVIKYLQKTYDDAMSKELKEETVQNHEDNRQFEEAVKGLENVQKALKDEIKD